MTESVIPVAVASSTTGLLWDSWPGEAALLASYDATTITSHVIMRYSVRGPYAESVGSTALPAGQTPLWLAGGEMGLHGQDGRLLRLMLSSHSAVLVPETCLNALLRMRRYKEAWSACQSDEDWRLLAEASLRDLEFEIANRAFRRLKDVGMVRALEEAAEAENRSEAAGIAALCIGDHDLAEQAFLQSDRPAAALAMRSSLLQWPQALNLAASLAPEQVPQLAKQYAQQLEFT